MICTDKDGCQFEVTGFGAGDFTHLFDFYDTFSPKARFQGMPPREKETLKRWLKMLIRDGENFLAWRDDKCIGHVALLPDFEKQDAEYLIFVNQSNRGLGVGPALTRSALRAAGRLGLKTVWLTVNAYNFRATKLYRKCGFCFCEAFESPSERMMEYLCGCENAT